MADAPFIPVHRTGFSGAILIKEEYDPELLKLVRATNDLALADSALPRKIKFLIPMALDASEGAVEGIKSLAEQAMKSRVTREEIVETLRVAQYIFEVGSVYTAARAFKKLFVEDTI